MEKREEAYLLLNKIEDACAKLNIDLKYQHKEFLQNIEIEKISIVTEKLYAYLRANKDHEILLDCCKINREIILSYSINNKNPSLSLCYRTLLNIHNLALSCIWNVAGNEINNFYINHKDGKCYNRTTGCMLLKKTELIDQPDNEIIEEIYLPHELKTKEVEINFKRAIKANFMKPTSRGYKWIFGGNKGHVRLGYFLNKILKRPRPINAIEELFKVKKISAAISNADYEAKRADVKKWRKDIDDIILCADD